MEDSEMRSECRRMANGVWAVQLHKHLATPQQHISGRRALAPTPVGGVQACVCVCAGPNSGSAAAVREHSAHTTSCTPMRLTP